MSQCPVREFNQHVPQYDTVLSFFILNYGVENWASQVDHLSSTMWGFTDVTVKGFLLVKDA